MEKYGRARKITDDIIIRRMRVGNWITKDKNTHSEYLMLAFPRQQWLRQRASVLRCIYIACLFTSYFPSSVVSSFSFRSFFSYLLVPVLHYSFPCSLFSIFFFLLHLPITLSLLSEQTPLQKLEQCKPLELVRVDSSLIRFLDEGATMTVRVFWN